MTQFVPKIARMVQGERSGPIDGSVRASLLTVSPPPPFFVQLLPGFVEESPKVGVVEEGKNRASFGKSSGNLLVDAAIARSSASSHGVHPATS